MSRLSRRACLAVAFFGTVCSTAAVAQPLRPVEVNRTIGGRSAYPLALEPERVGSYPALSKSGGGYFFDDVLEYRVWFHPEHGGGDQYAAFAQFETALAYARKTKGAEPPLVLIRQIEWVDEPKPGVFVPMKELRISEWQVQWLVDSKRDAKSVSSFISSRGKVLK